MRAARSGCASCAASSTWSSATGTCGRERPARGIRSASRRPADAGSAAIARVGLLGGTFNPPHVGHLICAQEALEQLTLDVVLLVPTGSPPHKEVRNEPGAHVRLELCRAAVAGEERIGVSDLEVVREGPSYTVDTLRALHELDPGDELTFIVGADMAQSLVTWREPREVLRLARLAVAERAGVGRAAIAERLAPLEAEARVVYFDMPRIDVSSSALRRRVAEGRSVRHWVPDPVAHEIAARGLYRPEDAARAAPNGITA